MSNSGCRFNPVDRNVLEWNLAADENLEGKTVLIVLNDNNSEVSFSINHGDNTASATLPSGGVGTYLW